MAKAKHIFGKGLLSLDPRESFGAAKDILLGTPPSLEEVDIQTPEQKELSSRVFQLLKGGLGETFQDDSRVPNRIQGTLNTGANRLGEILEGRPATSVNPAATNAFFERSIQDPALRDLQEKILPALKEQFISTGTFRGTPFLNKASEVTSDLAQSLEAKRAELLFQDETQRRQISEAAADRAASALPLAGDFATRGLNLQTLQFQNDFQKFMATRPESMPAFQEAMDFLGLTMRGFVTNSGQEGLAGPLLNAAGSAAGAALVASDRRLKENLVRVGTLSNGIPVYTFNYIGASGHKYLGVVAQDVEKVIPRAVHEISGYKHVDYGLLEDIEKATDTEKGAS